MEKPFIYNELKIRTQIFYEMKTKLIVAQAQYDFSLKEKQKTEEKIREYENG